jgi:hypothetical protein
MTARICAVTSAALTFPDPTALAISAAVLQV